MIYYLGHYSCEQIEKEKRKASPPAMNKMEYIISSLEEVVDEKLMIVSPCETELKKYVRGTLYTLNKQTSLKTFDSFFCDNRILRCLGHFLTKIQMILYLAMRIKKKDTIIVYHSLALMKIVRIIKTIKKCELIIETEELYSDVKENVELRKKEINYLELADKYIVITELLNKEINEQNKPKVISHGTYRTKPKYSEKFNDGKIHVVYAGSFNPIKGGALTAISAAIFLDDNYVLHILGKGSKSDTDHVIESIKEVSLKTNCQIIFEGFKSGIEFDSFIQSCHIGLSTQQPDGKYNASSFPSKILMYMSNDVPVVSVKIPAVVSSKVGKYICYYEKPTGQNIAMAIKSVCLENYMSVRSVMEKLDISFKEDLRALL